MSCTTSPSSSTPTSPVLPDGPKATVGHPIEAWLNRDLDPQMQLGDGVFHPTDFPARMIKPNEVMTGSSQSGIAKPEPNFMATITILGNKNSTFQPVTRQVPVHAALVAEGKEGRGTGASTCKNSTEWFVKLRYYAIEFDDSVEAGLKDMAVPPEGSLNLRLWELDGNTKRAGGDWGDAVMTTSFQFNINKMAPATSSIMRQLKFVKPVYVCNLDEPARPPFWAGFQAGVVRDAIRTGQEAGYPTPVPLLGGRISGNGGVRIMFGVRQHSDKNLPDVWLPDPAGSSGQKSPYLSLFDHVFDPVKKDYLLRKAAETIAGNLYALRDLVEDNNPDRLEAKQPVIKSDIRIMYWSSVRDNPNDPSKWVEINPDEPSEEVEDNRVLACRVLKIREEALAANTKYRSKPTTGKAVAPKPAPEAEKSTTKATNATVARSLPTKKAANPKKAKVDPTLAPISDDDDDDESEDEYADDGMSSPSTSRPESVTSESDQDDDATKTDGTEANEDKGKGEQESVKLPTFPPTREFVFIFRSKEERERQHAAVPMSRQANMSGSSTRSNRRKNPGQGPRPVQSRPQSRQQPRQEFGQPGFSGFSSAPGFSSIPPPPGLGPHHQPSAPTQAVMFMPTVIQTENGPQMTWAPISAEQAVAMQMGGGPPLGWGNSGPTQTGPIPTGSMPIQTSTIAMMQANQSGQPFGYGSAGPFRPFAGHFQPARGFNGANMQGFGNVPMLVPVQQLGVPLDTRSLSGSSDSGSVDTTATNPHSHHRNRSGPGSRNGGPRNNWTPPSQRGGPKNGPRPNQAGKGNARIKPVSRSTTMPTTLMENVKADDKCGNTSSPAKSRYDDLRTKMWRQPTLPVSTPVN